MWCEGARYVWVSGSPPDRLPQRDQTTCLTRLKRGISSVNNGELYSCVAADT